MRWSGRLSTISFVRSRPKLLVSAHFVRILTMYQVFASEGMIASVWCCDDWCIFLLINNLTLLFLHFSACPLANSRYATIREEEGVCYLYIKTAERAHTPKYLWEKIKLPANYSKALELVSGQLEHFPKYLVHRNKQRLTKIHQMLIRMRKLKLRAKWVLFSIRISCTIKVTSFSWLKQNFWLIKFCSLIKIQTQNSHNEHQSR